MGASLRDNKRIVAEFYDAVVNRKDYDAAAHFLGPDYRQHNPFVADGPDGLREFIGFLRDRFPEAHNEVMRIIAEGDYVVLHVHSVRTPDTTGRAIIELIRLEHGKVVEHWDVIQEIPEESANPNGML
jgi:predicted SnoaL-like aldol condensation-catalyzing enzyme